MKRILSIISLCICLFQSIAQENAFHIKGEVTSLRSAASLILTWRENNQWTEHRAEAKAGKFVISGKVDEPSFAYLVLKYNTELDKGPRSGNVLELFVDNSLIGLKTADSLREAQITGGKVQSDFEAYRKKVNEWKSRKTELRTDELKNEMVADFIRQRPSSYVSIFAIQNLSMDESFSLDANEAEPLFDLLSTEMKSTPAGKALQKDIQIAKSTLVGAIAPDFVQNDTSNQPVNLKSFRGKYVFIDFWASWCRPCRAENPQLVKVFNEYKDKGLTVIGVSLDHSKTNWIKAIAKDHLTWTQVSDLQFWKNEVALLYGVKTVPQNFLIGPNGEIVDKGIPVSELQSKLSKYFQ
jgi:peroxiredoxin